MRKFKAEINFLAADAADFLCRIDLFLVRVELCSMRAVMIGTHIRHFSHLQNGIKKAPLRCLVFFEFYAKDIIEVVNAYPCAFLFDDDSIAVVSIVVPFSLAIGYGFTAFEGDLNSFSVFHNITAFRASFH